ncbi:CsbD family protein [Streptomyces alkaliphilus]|uniref:CsbD family protein n=1 Tax=Streptomyces alkaliphilus TaxID=1472722 RepID=A0A7W3TEN3_9ACTN|nr:CsbD family protein [Streptomyces alkaliphilus]MBB0245463.1 CsbD family protein [Streptomyces alkaliphilus]MQS06829.1 CsbD family protein [Streptomyces alkaliphilus]
MTDRSDDKGTTDKLKGKAKEMVGKVTGDRRKEQEGKTDQAKGKTKETFDDVKGKAKGVGDSLGNDRSGDR